MHIEIYCIKSHLLLSSTCHHRRMKNKWAHWTPSSVDTSSHSSPNHNGQGERQIDRHKRAHTLPWYQNWPPTTVRWRKMAAQYNWWRDRRLRASDHRYPRHVIENSISMGLGACQQVLTPSIRGRVGDQGDYADFKRLKKRVSRNERLKWKKSKIYP